MNNLLEENLKYVDDVLKQAETYEHAVRVLNYDLETICPTGGMSEQGKTIAFLANQAFRLKKDEKFIEAAEFLYQQRDSLGEFDRTLAELLHRERQKTKNLTPDEEHRLEQVYNKAYEDWLEAKKVSDYSVFLPSLQAVRDANLREVELREQPLPNVYDNLLDDYERGMRSEKLDEIFTKCLERLTPLLDRITHSKKRIRTDFLHRLVPDEQQREMAEFLLGTIGFDFKRGAFTTTEHPFTDGLARDDARVTTHYYPADFASSMYSIIHEGGHALFEQLQPAENFDHHIQMEKTMGQHESVSRFYENRIGRSEAFVHLVYPDVKRIFPEAMYDVSEREFYEALNVVEPSLIRTEADEFTYTLHIIIRYELEKRIVAGEADLTRLPETWADMYEKYLGVRPSNDREGVLQDVHWASGFGYFPTYALGNMYNAMYYNKMAEDMDIDETVANGDFEKINGWMAEHVFKKADRLAPGEWIRDITGRELTPDDFLDYLENKYTELYEL